MVMLLLLIVFAESFHKVTLKQAQTTSWTHICVTGPVVYVRAMKDGDIHITLDDGRDKIVAEIIPAIQLPRPKKGVRITVCGISRWDKRHRWAEVHPVLSWTEARS